MAAWSSVCMLIPSGAPDMRPLMSLPTGLDEDLARANLRLRTDVIGVHHS